MDAPAGLPHRDAQHAPGDPAPACPSRFVVKFWNHERSDAPGLRVVSRPVIEQIARDSHQGPSREISGVQEVFALVDTNVLRDLQKEGSGVPATIGGVRQACLPAWQD